jgi:hypothetical protein
VTGPDVQKLAGTRRLGLRHRSVAVGLGSTASSPASACHSRGLAGNRPRPGLILAMIALRTGGLTVLDNNVPLIADALIDRLTDAEYQGHEWLAGRSVLAALPVSVLTDVTMELARRLTLPRGKEPVSDWHRRHVLG